MAENLNNFYCTFNQQNFTLEWEELISDLATMSFTTANLELQPGEAEQVLKRINPNKAPGPDQICGHLLKACLSQLSGVLCKLFNSYLTCDNDYHPIALTSLPMKSFERLVLSQLQKEEGVHTDPLQFADKQRGVDDAVLTLLHGAFTHLEKV